MKRWLLCGAFCLMAAVLPSLGMLQLEGAASCLPEGIFYADPNEAVGQPVAEDALDSPWIASYVREGERITFLLFSSQVATSRGSGAAGGFPAGPWRWGAGPLHRRCCSHAPPAENRFLAGIDSLSAGHRLWPYREGHSPLVAKVLPKNESGCSRSSGRSVPGAVCRIHLCVAVPANPRHFSAHRAFLRPAVLCLPNPLGLGGRWLGPAGVGGHPCGGTNGTRTGTAGCRLACCGDCRSASDTGLAQEGLQNRWEELNLYAKAGRDSSLLLAPKEGVPPAQKLSRIKQRIGFALGNLKNGMEDG